MTEIKIGERTIPLMLTTYELIAIQDEIGCTVGQLQDEVFGIERDFETGKVTGMKFLTEPGKMKKVGTLIRIMGNAALEEQGETPDLQDKWVLRHIKPAMMAAYGVAVMAVINDAMLMEAGKKEAKEPVDEVLEEENRKKEPGN